MKADECVCHIRVTSSYCSVGAVLICAYALNVCVQVCTAACMMTATRGTTNLFELESNFSFYSPGLIPPLSFYFFTLHVCFPLPMFAFSFVSLPLSLCLLRVG